MVTKSELVTTTVASKSSPTVVKSVSFPEAGFGNKFWIVAPAYPPSTDAVSNNIAESPIPKSPMFHNPPE